MRQMLVIVGDARHKKMPVGEAKPVTDLFLKKVTAALAANDAQNTEHKLKPGMKGYLTATHADIATELDVDPNSVKNLLGGVRSGTKAVRPKRSKLVDPISKLLGIRLRIAVEVDEDRRRHAELINKLTTEQLAEFLATYEK